MMRSIESFPQQRQDLSAEKLGLFDRVYHAAPIEAAMRIPEPMRPRVLELFGEPGEAEEACVRRVETQKMLRVIDRWSLEGTVFSSLRARRPRVRRTPPEPGANPDFATPLAKTPFAPWQDGRVEGKWFLSAENLCAFGRPHGMILARDLVDALHVACDRSLLADLLETAERWFGAAQEAYPAAAYRVLGMNAGGVSGATDRRAHAQVSMGEGLACPWLESQRRACVSYRRSFDSSLWSGRYDLHQELDLTICSEAGVEAIAILTPPKERGVELSAHSLSACVDVLHRILNGMIREEGVGAFNLMAYWRPQTADGCDWRDVPPLTIRIVERGDYDIAQSELLAKEVVVSYCPWEFARRMRALV